MADSRILNPEQALASLAQNGWPRVTIITGPLTRSLTRKIRQAISNELYRNQNEKKFEPEEINRMLDQNEHPDYYCFADEKIKIGERKNPEPGTVRHLIDHVLSYSPRYGSSRFIHFENAAMIQNEAESALLKSLEESPEHTHFILAVESETQLKETIVSRAMLLSMPFVPDPNRISNDPWERFWYLSQSADTRLYTLMDEYGWLDTIRESYESLRYDPGDYALFEQLGWNRFREIFKKEDTETRSGVMRMNFLPLYFSVRDALTSGVTTAMGPVPLPGSSETTDALKKRQAMLFGMGSVLEQYFGRLSTRYFGTRAPDLNLVFFLFLSDFMKYWNFSPDKN